MAKLFLYANSDQCWICGSDAKLTREHKFKASDLKASFGKDDMAKVSWDLPADRAPKLMYSAKSRAAQFKPSICSDCNSSRTQAADQAYERFSTRIRELMCQQIEPFAIVEEHPWSSPREADSINCMRYFAKLLGCHAAEVGAPIPTDIIESINNEKSLPRIRCEIFSHVDRKQLIENATANGDPLQYVAHFGLQVIFDDVTLKPIKYLSGISIDWAEIMFEYPLNWSERRQLAKRHSSFLDSVKEEASIHDKRLT